MADQPSPRRRFQFRLRTLMIVVTLLAVACGYVGSQAKVARERHQAMATHRTIYPDVNLGPRGEMYQRWTGVPVIRPEAPWPLRWFGEQGYWGINSGDTASDDEVANLKRLFPEAEVWRDQKQY